MSWSNIMAIESDEFPMCCGITVIHGFGWDGTHRYHNEGTEYYEEGASDAQIRQAIIRYRRLRALALIAINNKQYEKFGHVLKERKLKLTLVTKQYHPSHRSYIYLYMYKGNKKPKKRTIKKKIVRYFNR